MKRATSYDEKEETYRGATTYNSSKSFNAQIHIYFRMMTLFS